MSLVHRSRRRQRWGCRGRRGRGFSNRRGLGDRPGLREDTKQPSARRKGRKNLPTVPHETVAVLFCWFRRLAVAGPGRQRGCLGGHGPRQLPLQSSAAAAASALEGAALSGPVGHGAHGTTNRLDRRVQSVSGLQRSRRWTPVQKRAGPRSASLGGARRAPCTSCATTLPVNCVYENE